MSRGVLKQQQCGKLEMLTLLIGVTDGALGKFQLEKLMSKDLVASS
jgi:hypothetical protein